MNYYLGLEDGEIVLRTDTEESWNNKLVMTGITDFQFDNNFLIIGNSQVTKFLRFGDLTIDKRVTEIIKRKNNESQEIK